MMLWGPHSGPLLLCTAAAQGLSLGAGSAGSISLLSSAGRWEGRGAVVPMGWSLPEAQPWSWVSHPCVFPIKPHSSGLQSPGTVGLSLEGTHSPAPFLLLARGRSLPGAVSGHHRSSLSTGLGEPPVPPDPFCSPGPAGRSGAIPADDWRGPGASGAGAWNGRMEVAGPRRWDPLGQRVSETWTFAPSDLIFDVFFSGSSPYHPLSCLPGVRTRP